MLDAPSISSIIQLSIAPVFLLSAIGGMLAVMTNRLSRVVDRARSLEAELGSGKLESDVAFRDELASLSKRARLVSRAISLCTATALLVCALIATLFVGAFFDVDTSVLVAVLFVVSMIAFFLGLLFFMREVLLATKTLRVGGAVLQPRRPSNLGGER